MAPRMDTGVFRPAPGLRLLAACVVGVLLCLVSAALYAAASGRVLALAAVAVIVPWPSILSAAVLARSVRTDADGLESCTLLGAKRICWPDVRRIDVRRGTFVIESTRGPISAALIDPRTRDSLLRLVVDRARLARVAEDLPWGIDARYIPRSQDIEFTEFVPHHKRRPPASTNDH